MKKIYLLLTSGFAGVGAAALLGADVPALMSCVGTSFVGPVAKFAVSFGFIYHYAGAVRHALWDKNPDAMLHNDKVEQTAYALLAGSAVAAGACAFVSI